MWKTKLLTIVFRGDDFRIAKKLAYWFSGGNKYFSEVNNSNANHFRAHGLFRPFTSLGYAMIS